MQFMYTDPPAPIEEIIENIVKFHPNGEATFASIGLGGWSPLGLVQQFFEFVHITGNVPWWATIVIGIYIFLHCRKFIDFSYRFIGTLN